MEQNAAHLSWVEQLWAWFEPKKKQVLIGFAAVLVVGFAAGYHLWSQGEKERVAGEAFSKVAAAPLFSPGAAESADAYLKVASGQPGTLAGSRALLQAATVFFTQGKFADAQSQFERLAREYPEGALFPQARLGAAACLDAQGKAPEAAALYKEVSEKFATTSVAPQARFHASESFPCAS